MREADVDATCRRLVRALGAAGWLRYCVRAADGGALPALDSRALCVARETLAFHDGLADFAFAMQGLGSGALTLAGTDAQRARWLPAVARGDAIAAFALSEPDAGSDVGALTTRAVRDGAHWVLDGCKTWISNGGIADFYCVFARTGAGTTRGEGHLRVRRARDARGLVVAERIAVMAPHPLARIEFAGCRVGADALIGAEGDGFKLAMRTLDIFRASVAAAAVGFARRALSAAQARARARRMFGGVLADRELAQATLGDMATDVDAAALLTYRAAWLRDVRNARTTKEAAMAKLAATESAQRVIDAAVQMHGALGVAHGQVVERLYRDIRALRIYEGATDVQRLIVGRASLAEAKEAAHDDIPPTSTRLPATTCRRAANGPISSSTLPELRYPDALNCATELLDGALLRGWGDAHGDPRARRHRAGRTRTSPRTPTASRTCWSRTWDSCPGNRVLLRGPNSPMDGGLLVRDRQGRRHRRGDDAAAPREGTDRHRDQGADQPRAVRRAAGRRTRGRAAGLPDARARSAGSSRTAATASRRARRASPRTFADVRTAADDTALIAFTSGTTGMPKGTMHFHRDVHRRLRLLAALDAARRGRRRLHRQPAARVHVRPGRTPAVSAARRRGDAAGRAAVAGRPAAGDRRVPRDRAVHARRRRTARWLRRRSAFDLSSLRKCVSAGEALPAATRKLWKDATGIEIIDGIGATEMLHIFISHDEAHARPGATGTPVPGLSGLRDGRRRGTRCRRARSGGSP